MGEGKKTKEGNGEGQEPGQQQDSAVKMDEILKVLFGVSKKVLLAMLNSLFEENFDAESTSITYENSEFVSDDYDIIRGDLFLKLQADPDKPYHYHIEFQTRHEAGMVIRMFEYGFGKGKELAELSGDTAGDEVVIHIPNQIVIYIEQNENIPDELKLLLVFPGGESYRYHIPVMKYWEYSTEELINRRLYPLIALQVFKLRHKLEQIKRRSGDTEEQLKSVILEAKDVAIAVATEERRLNQEGIITTDDLHSILKATNSLFMYLNKRYANIDQLNEEVQTMIKSLYDPEVEKRGIEKGIERGIEKGREEVAKQMWLEGEDIDKIKRYTGLSDERIMEIKDSITH